MAKHGKESMFWRFWAAADPTVERFISRDVDSRLMPRDAIAVAAWIESGKGFHVVRDHPSHSLYPMSGGLWGATRGSLSNVMELIAAYPADSEYLTDMNFLNSKVWPLAMDNVLQHDAFSCEEFDGALPFPVERDLIRGDHVGEVFDVNGNGRADDVSALKEARQPAACKPGGDPSVAQRARAEELGGAGRREECARMQGKHGVRVGKTWGTLPPSGQLRWQRIACDSLAGGV